MVMAFSSGEGRDSQVTEAISSLTGYHVQINGFTEMKQENT